MANMIVGMFVVLMIAGAGGYLYREKKRGSSCIGCPSGGVCSGKCSRKS